MYLTYQYYINLFILDLWTYSVKTALALLAGGSNAYWALREQYIEPQANTRTLGFTLDYVSLLSHLLQYFHNIFLLTHTPLKFPAPQITALFLTPQEVFSDQFIKNFLNLLITVLVFHCMNKSTTI